MGAQMLATRHVHPLALLQIAGPRWARLPAVVGRGRVRGGRIGWIWIGRGGFDTMEREMRGHMRSRHLDGRRQRPREPCRLSLRNANRPQRLNPEAATLWHRFNAESVQDPSSRPAAREMDQM